jgi:hypothetical protein
MSMYANLYLPEFFLESEMFQMKFVEKIKTLPPPPRKSCHLWDNVEKYGTAGQATDDNAVQALWTL